MADNIVGIKFGVAGGKSFLAGSSGALIKGQLEAIASKINLKVNINKTYFKSQLSSLKKDLDATLGNLNINVNTRMQAGTQKDGVSTDSATSTETVNGYEEVTKALDKLYQAKVKLLKMPMTEDGKYASVAGVKASNEEKTLYLRYKQQFEELKKLENVDKTRINNINKYSRELKKAYEIQKNITNNVAKQPTAADPTAVAKIQKKAASLYTDDGFDKVIKRSAEAKKLVDEFAQKIKNATADGHLVSKDELKKLDTEFLKVQTRLKEIGRKTDTVGNSIKEAFSSKIIQRIAQSLLLSLVRALGQVYQNVKEIDKAMTELRIVTNATGKQLDESAKRIAKSAKQIGVSVSDLIKSTTIYARLGYGLKDAEILGEKTTVYAKVAGASVGEATTNITGIIKAFNIGAEGLEGVLDQMIWVGNNFAISEAEIGEAMNNAASSLAANGNTLQEAIGIVTAANVTLQNVSKSSTAVRTIAARISRSTAELEELGEDAGSILSTSDLDAKMSAFGVSVAGANGELRSTYDILNDLAKRWDELNGTERAAIADMLAGTRQQNAFYSIMQNWGDATNIVGNASKGVGTLRKAQEKYVDSIEGKINKLKATWEQFSTTMLSSGFVKMLFDVLGGIANALAVVNSELNGGLTNVAIIIPTVILVLSVLKKLNLAFINFTKTIKITKTGVRGFFTTVGAAMKKFMAENAPMLIITAMVTLMTTLEGKTQGFTEIIVGAMALIVGAIIIGVKGIDATIKGFMASNPLGWILAAIVALAAVGKGIYDLVKSYNPSYEDLKKAAKETVDAWKEAEDKLEDVRSKIKEIEDELARLNALESPTLIDEKEIERLEEQLTRLKSQEKVETAAADIAKDKAMAVTYQAAEKLSKKRKKENKSGKYDPDSVVSYLTEYSTLLADFEYGTSERMNHVFDEYYSLLDEYTIATEGAAATWSSILSRVKNKDAVAALEEFANTFKDTSKITGDALRDLAAKKPEVKELLEYLSSVGMWDGNDWDKLTSIVGDLRTKLTELALVNIVDDIEAITDKFDTLSNALSEVSANGIISLDTLQALIDKYPTLLNKYFDKSSDGYQLSDEYKDLSNYDILQDTAVASLVEYQDALTKAKETLKGLAEEDDDYETALKNLATAQDNLNTKQLEWATILREAAITEESDKLEKVKEGLEEQLNVYKEVIDIRKDLLKTYKDEFDYQKELSKKQKSVADLQTRLSLAKLDKSASGQARVRELESQLQDAQDALDEYTLERAIQDITAALDKEYGEYDEIIKEQVSKIAIEIENIALTLKGILAGVEGLTNSKFSESDKYDLYTELKKKEAQGMTIDTDTRSFMDSVSKGDYAGADKLYSAAKEKSDSFELEENPNKPKGKTEDELTAEKMTPIKGAWVTGVDPDKPRNNGDVSYGKDTKYKIEGGGVDNSLKKAASTKFGEGDVFYYSGELYGYSGGVVFRIQERENSYKANHGKGYVALKKAIEAAGIYHTGGFVGDISDLQSNEEFAKLLKGELVSTPRQMDDFMKKTLPRMVTYDGGGQSVINNNSPLIEIKCGSVNDDTLPQLNNLVRQAVTRIEENMKNALSRTGYKKKY